MYSFGKPPPVNYDDGGNDPDSVEILLWDGGLGFLSQVSKILAVVPSKQQRLPNSIIGLQDYKWLDISVRS